MLLEFLREVAHHGAPRDLVPHRPRLEGATSGPQGAPVERPEGRFGSRDPPAVPGRCLVERPPVLCVSVIDRLAALHLRDALPRRGDRRHRAVVDGAHVFPDQRGEDGPRQCAALEALRVRLAQNVLQEGLHPLPELRAELAGVHLLEFAQLALVRVGSHQRHAVPVGEERLDGPPDGVLGLHRGACPGHQAQRRLEVVPRRARAPEVLLEVQVEVPQEPEEGGRVRGDVLGALALRADADVLRHLGDQRQAVQRGLVDPAHLVVHEDGRE